MRAVVRFFQRNWEFGIQVVIGVAFLVLLVGDHFGWATLDSGAIGTTIVGLLFFASIRLTRQSDELSELRAEVGVLRQHQLTEGEIRQVPGDRIKDVLGQMLDASDQWHFRGGSARWQLEEVLPHLADRRDLPSRYVMQIIDPRDEHLRTRYGQYRAKSRTRDQAPTMSDGPDEVMRDLLACIYAAGWYRVNSQVRPEITLLRSYSPLRIDCGSSGLMVTIANKSAPGLFASKGTWYYRSVLDELEQLEEVSGRLTLPRDPSLYPADLSVVSNDNVKAMLGSVTVRTPDGAEVGLGDGGALAAIDCEGIAGKVRGSAN